MFGVARLNAVFQGRASQLLFDILAEKTKRWGSPAYRLSRVPAEQSVRQTQIQRNLYDAGTSSMTDLMQAQGQFQQACIQFVNVFAHYRVSFTLTKWQPIHYKHHPSLYSLGVTPASFLKNREKCWGY